MTLPPNPKSLESFDSVAPSEFCPDEDLARIYHLFCSADFTHMDIHFFLTCLDESGIKLTDPRLKSSMHDLCKVAGFEDTRVKKDSDIHWFRGFTLTKAKFCKTFAASSTLTHRALGRTLVIQDWPNFCGELEELYEDCEAEKTGEVNTHVPECAKADPKLFALSVCSIDGQRTSWGEHYMLPFTLQSLVFVINYAVAMHELGAAEVHKYVGTEPSGQPHNAICLDKDNKPHNPIINAGAMVTCSLLARELTGLERVEYVMSFCRRMAGNLHVGFNESGYKSGLNVAYRNHAIAYYLIEHDCFPPGTLIESTIKFFERCCAIECSSESLAVIAATLAKGGVCPLTGERVLSNEACRNALSLMFSCGMYSYSGMFAFKIGLPAKSSATGAMVLVVPGVCAFSVYSPRLDENGNSKRGIRFCELLVKNFNFHNYDNLLHSEEAKIDPRRTADSVKSAAVNDVLYAAKAGDLDALKRLLALGANLNASDYDRRTALHVAASEGHTHVVLFLIQRCNANVAAKDRWGHTPTEDAETFQHLDCLHTMLNCIQREKRRKSSVVSSKLAKLNLNAAGEADRMSMIAEETHSIKLHQSQSAAARLKKSDSGSAGPSTSESCLHNKTP